MSNDPAGPMGILRAIFGAVGVGKTDSPLPPCGEELLRLLAEYAKQAGANYRARRPVDHEAGRRILALSDKQQAELVYGIAANLLESGGSRTFTAQLVFAIKAERQLLSQLLRKPLPFDPADFTKLLRRVLQQPVISFFQLPIRGVVRTAHRIAEIHGLSSETREILLQLRARLSKPTDRFSNKPSPDARDAIGVVDAILGLSQSNALHIEPGEAWSDLANADLAAMSPPQRGAWVDLLNHARSAKGSKPSGKWLKAARGKTVAIGEDVFAKTLTNWLTAVAKPRTQTAPPSGPYRPDPNWLFNEGNSDLLKGLAWTAASATSGDAVVLLARALANCAEASFKKITWLGPRCTKLGNACLFALSNLPGNEAVAQLSRLNARIKQPTGRKMSAKALTAVSLRTGMDAQQLEEISAPMFDLDSQARLRKTIGEFAAELRVVGTDTVQLTWLGQGGKSQKSIPAELKDKHAEQIKAIKTTAKDIEQALTGHRVRLERLFLGRRDWTLSDWRKFYADHPLVAVLARKMIWQFRCGEQKQTGAFLDDKIVDVSNSPLSLETQTRVSLWHPIHDSADRVLAWREWLEKHQITQPFKQAHREIYVLTDAERQTETYSNRFAAHVLRQHQFAALAQQRGWNYRLQGQFDSHNVPFIHLPTWNMRVELWVEPVENNQASETGIFLHVTTDQVRFSEPQDGTARSLKSIDPLLFSELMRDVDLFVGVASIGNDPDWQDRGDANHLNYWHGFAFGELSATATTRKQVLERLIPHLKIASRCSFSEKFLIVRGDKRTYKIHLGSANIMMEPNDQYLCIVPDRRVKRDEDKLFLPFEGDNTLSIILSKAFLLAEDSKITDATILRQISR